MDLLPNATWSDCVPCAALLFRYNPPTLVDSKHICPTVSPSATPYPAPKLSDESFEACERILTCDTFRTQLKESGEAVSCLNDGGRCFCIGNFLKDCNSTLDCVFRETCIKFQTNSSYSYCSSCYGISVRIPQLTIVDSNHACEGGIYESTTATVTAYPTPSTSYSCFESNTPSPSTSISTIPSPSGLTQSGSTFLQPTRIPIPTLPHP